MDGWGQRSEGVKFVGQMKNMIAVTFTGTVWIVGVLNYDDNIFLLSQATIWNIYKTLIMHLTLSAPLIHVMRMGNILFLVRKKHPTFSVH